MMLKLLKVEGWRCFADEVELSSFGGGLNIVYGPNGVGKSTLFGALVRGFCDSHLTKGEAIKGLRPSGRSLTPRVVIEFSHADEQYRLSKQFLDSPRCELARYERGDYVRVAEGRHADEKLQQMLQVEPVNGGTKKPSHWGLAQLLWAQQGELKLEELSGSVSTSLRAALGAQTVTPEASAVEERIQSAYDDIYTPTGAFKSGANAPEFKRLEQRRETLREERRRAQDKLRQFDEATEQIDRRRSAAASARQKEAALEERSQQATTEANGFEKKVAEQQTRRHAVAAARAKYDELKARVDSLAAARAEQKSQQQTLEELDQVELALAEEIKLRGQELRAAEDRVLAARQDRPQEEAASRRARQARRFQQAQQQLAAAKRVLDAVAATQAQLAPLEAERSSLAAPDPKLVQQLVQAERERDDARVRLEASLITLELTAEAPLALQVQAAEQPGPRHASAGETLVLQGSPEVVLHLPGVGVVRARGPSGSAEKLRGQWQAALEKVEQLGQKLPARDLETLHNLVAEAAVLDRRLVELRSQRDGLLGGRALAAWNEECQLAQHQVTELLAEEPGWAHEPPQVEALEAEADRINREFKRAIDAAEGEQKQRLQAHSAVSVRKEKHDGQRRQAVTQLKAAQTAAARVEADGLADSARDQQLRTFLLEWEAARVGLDSAEAQLKDWADPRAAAEMLRTQLVAARKEAEAAAKQLHNEEGQLARLTSESPYSALAAAEEELAKVEEALAREKLQVDAVKLLHAVLAERKKELVETLVGPVKQRASQTFARIAGAKFKGVELSESFEAAGVLPRDAGETWELAALSGGEKEQVHFAVRLALADVVFEQEQRAGEKPLVVLDDVFTFTDDFRFARILTILREAAERFQIVVLTCHPERYRGLQEATFFDLEAELKGAKALV